MSLNNGKHEGRSGTAVMDFDPVKNPGQERNSGPQKDASFTAEAKDRGSGRDGQGRFVPGNPGGPGNPFARRVGELRRAMLAAVKPEDVADIIKAIVAKAKEGHVQAAKLVLSYALGKPQPVADPDRADVDEWELQEETAAMSQGMAAVLKAPPAAIPLGTARVLRPIMGQIMKEKMADMLLHPENHFPDMPKLEIVPDKEGPSANGVFAKAEGRAKGEGLEMRREAAPSANGVIPKAKGGGVRHGSRHVSPK